MLKKWFEIIYDHKVSLRERMFRLATGVCIVALVIILPMGRSIFNLLVLAASLICMVMTVKISIQKECINTGATIITILLLILFPLSFFSAGGFYSGMPEWFVLCFIYVSITLEGRRKIGFFLFCTAETMFCYWTAYYFPASVANNTQGRSFFDSAASVVLVGVLASVLLMFLNRLYEKENKITKQQKKEIEELNEAENHFFPV